MEDPLIVLIHLDVDSSPHVFGPFAAEELANAKLADTINAFLADERAAGRVYVDVWTDEPASDVTAESVAEYQSDFTGLADLAYRRVITAPDDHLVRFFLARINN